MTKKVCNSCGFITDNFTIFEKNRRKIICCERCKNTKFADFLKKKEV